MKSSHAVLACALLLLVSNVSVLAQRPMPPQHPHGMRGAMPPPPPMEIPNLSDQQKEQIKKLHDGFKEVELNLRNQLGEKEARLRTVTTAEKVDEADVNTLVDEIGSLRNQLFKSHVMLDLKIRELLTDEQRLFFDTMPKKPHGPPPPMM